MEEGIRKKVLAGEEVERLELEEEKKKYENKAEKGKLDGEAAFMNPDSFFVAV